MSFTAHMRLLMLVLSLMVAVAACGGAQSSAPIPQPSSDAALGASDGPTAEASATAAFPVTVTAANGEITLDQAPGSIVSLSPTATEILFAIGAGDRVTAVDEYSTYPSEAPTSDLSGLDPNVEAIAGYEPDLVVVADDGADLTSALGALDIPVLSAPAATTLDDTYEQIAQLGAVSGRGTEAAALTDQMRDDIDAIVAEVPAQDESLTYYHELDDTYYSVTSDTFIGQIYDLVGLTNIADAAGDDAGGYPQLSEEFIVDADPDLIFLADTKCCGQTAQTVAQRPGWDGLTAVEQDAIVELDDDIASRWGPRVVDLLRTVGDAVAANGGS